MIDGVEQYQLIAFHYIHQNPFNAGLVKKLADWHYSSYRDFAGLRKGTICDRVLAEQLIGFDKTNLNTTTGQIINDALLRKIFEKRDGPESPEGSTLVGATPVGITLVGTTPVGTIPVGTIPVGTEGQTGDVDQTIR